MHRRWPGSFVFRNASQRLRAVVLWLQQERPAREVYARYRGLFIPSPGCSRLSLSLSLGAGLGRPTSKWRHFRDATRLASMTRNAMTRHRDAYLAIFSPFLLPLPLLLLLLQISVGENVCTRDLTKFDEVWWSLTRFDEVWTGLNKFELLYLEGERGSWCEKGSLCCFFFLFSHFHFRFMLLNAEWKVSLDLAILKRNTVAPFTTYHHFSLRIDPQSI